MITFFLFHKFHLFQPMFDEFSGNYDDFDDYFLSHGGK